MARTAGARNADYELQRASLAKKVREALAGKPGIHASLRELATAAGTSVATLRHYFVDRDGLLQAVMQNMRGEAAPYLAMSAQLHPGDVRASLTFLVGNIQTAWFRYGVGSMYGATLALGLGSKVLGPGFVDHVLEPLLQTGEGLLRQHVERGELEIDDLRHASLMLLSPVVFALLHQDNLAGAGCRPLDVPKFLVTHVDAFLRAFPPTQAKKAKGPRAG